MPNLRLVGQDALPIDDRRYLTVVVRDPWLVLIVAPRDVDTSSLVEAIAPYQHRVENRATYECLTITPEEIAEPQPARLCGGGRCWIPPA